MDVAHPVKQRLCLARDGSNDLGMGVADVGHTKCGREIDEAIPIYVPHIRKGGTLPEDRNRVEGRHVPALDQGKPCSQCARLGTGDLATQRRSQRLRRISQRRLLPFRSDRGLRHEGIVGRCDEGSLERKRFGNFGSSNRTASFMHRCLG